MLSAVLRVPALRLPLIERRHWIASLVIGLLFALGLAAALSLPAGPADRAVAKVAPQLPAAAAKEAPPAPEPLRFREVPPQDAVAMNAAVPISNLPNPAARPFLLRASSEADTARAVDCLTAAIYYEAATEPAAGQRAVAQVVLNRVRHPAFPNTVCGVVFQGAERATGCQFTFTCDGSLARAPVPSIWARAKRIAEAALAGAVFKPVGWATHYHTDWVVPYWSSSLVKAAVVGTHIFYRWTGGWGTRPAFRHGHAGSEPTHPKMARLMGYSGVLAPADMVETASGGEPALAAAPPIADADRPVVRRFEPARSEDVAFVLASQTRAGEQVTASHRWALTGDSQASGQKPLGKRKEPAAEAGAADAKPKPPVELLGVRKVGEPTALASEAALASGSRTGS